MSLHAGRRLLLRVVVLTATIAGVACAPAHAARIFAITGEATPRLLSFDSSAPGTILTAVPLSGLLPGESVLGFDLRPATGWFTVLTEQGGTEQLRTLNAATGSLVTGEAVVNPLPHATGALVPPIPLVADPSDSSAPFAGLSGAGVGIDVNPVPDRVRVVTSSGQNVRVAPTTGNVFTDVDLNPGSPQVAAAAYTNSFPGAATTSLYDVDLATNQLMLQLPPNNGTLNAVGSLGISGLAAASTGLDIAPDGNAAFLSARTGLTSNLYTVNLTTGAATLIGAIGSGEDVPPGIVDIRDIATAENLVGVQAVAVAQPESSPTANVTVTRAEARSEATVQFTTGDGTATAGQDYAATSGIITFLPGEVAKTIAVPIIDDAADEAPETFTVALSTPTSGLGTTATLLDGLTTVTIADDDPAPLVSEPPAPTPVAPVVISPSKLFLLASAPERKRAKLRSSGLPVSFSCNEACAIKATLKKGTKTIGSGTGKLTAAGVGRLTAKLTSKGKTTLGRASTITVTLAGTTTAGHRATVKQTVRLR